VAHFALDRGKSAFIIIDMQSVFVENSPFAAPDGLEVLGRLNRLAAVCETTAREAAMRDFKVIFLSDGTTTLGLPDMAFGPLTAEEVQNVTCSVVGFFFGQVLTVDRVIEKITAPRVDVGSRRSA
jgi:ureidoacrylate peracid hydrolase